MISPLHINKQVIKETYHEEGQIECFDLGHLAVLIASITIISCRYKDESGANLNSSSLRTVNCI